MNEIMFSQVIMSELMFRVTHPGFSQKLSHSSNNQNTEKEHRKKKMDTLSVLSV